MLSHILLGSCLELLGANMAMDAFGLPLVCADSWTCMNGVCVPAATCGSTSMVGGPIEYLPGQCFLPLYFGDPWYSSLGINHDVSLWCQDVTIEADNGPVNVRTPCDTDPGVVERANAPYDIRLYWSVQSCPDWGIEWSMCELENVCTAADKLAGDCTCTAAEQANNECTP